jgi:transcriptional regulator GlxA family with amidase domain
LVWIKLDIANLGGHGLTMSPNAPQIPPIAPRRVEVLAFPDVQLLDVAGPVQVFAAANDQADRPSAPSPYRIRVVAPEGAQVRATSGRAFLAEPLPDPAEPLDTLIVAGGQGAIRGAEDARLVEWLKVRAGAARRTASVCTGAFLLAATGLLDRRRVVTHWDYCDMLRRLHPDVTVEPDPIFVHDGPVWTSAGVTAGIDLSLALVEEDLGRTIALAVARYLVVFLKRPGGQAQFSAALSLQSADDHFADLNGWLMEHLAEDLPLSRLAAQAAMSGADLPAPLSRGDWPHSGARDRAAARRGGPPVPRRDSAARQADRGALRVRLGRNDAAKFHAAPGRESAGLSTALRWRVR